MKLSSSSSSANLDSNTCGCSEKLGIRRKPKIVRRIPKRLTKKLHLLGALNWALTTDLHIQRLREEMAEIKEDQKSIKEGQRQVREKHEEIEREREKLKMETEVIAKQSADIHLKLSLMFSLSKARAQNNHALVAEITTNLRDLMAKPNEQSKKMKMKMDG